jgi:arylsulfatase B
MTDRWRLINGAELFDMNVDAGQKTDVASAHPEVIERLREFYESWWTELEPTFSQDVAIYLGHEGENPARLTAHDWITTGSTPWNHSHIRNAMTGPQNTGYWAVDVVAAGEYDIALRRWPAESGAALGAGLPAGEDVPGVQAYRAREGKALNITRASISIADQSAEAEVDPDAEDVVFRLTLPRGRTQLAGRFYTADGKEYGAYYAVVTRH